MLVLGRNPGQGVVLRLPGGREIQMTVTGSRIVPSLPKGVTVSMDIPSEDAVIVIHRLGLRCRAKGWAPMSIYAELARQPQGLRMRIDAPRDVVILRDELADWGGAKNETQS